MKIKSFLLSTFLFCCFLSCTQDEIIKIESSNITINLNENEFVTDENEYEIVIKDDLSLVNDLKLFIDGQLLQTFSSPPFIFSIDRTEYKDGKHVLKIHVSTSDDVTEKTINFLVDNMGPELVNSNLDQVFICGETPFKPEIKDASGISDAQLYINDKKQVLTGSSNFSFLINPEEFNGGISEAKLIMTDIIGNVSESKFDITIGKKLISIEFPDSFIRKSDESFYIMLSDKEGNYLDHKIYSGNSETIEFCSASILDPNTEYMLTFFEVFDNSIFNVFCYSNLSKNTVGEKIIFKNRTLSENAIPKDFNTSHLTLQPYVRSSGYSYSMVQLDNKISGHVTSSFLNNLGSNNAFIMSYDNSSFAKNNYSWAFIKDIRYRTSILESDFSTDNVINKEITFSRKISNQSLRVYAFENQKLYNVFNGHDIYDTPMTNVGEQTYRYQYANVFENYFYSLKADNYYKQGKGLPDNNMIIPNHNISFDLISNKLIFNGLTNYEVGRIRIEKENIPNQNIDKDNPIITIEFIFDGSKAEIYIPKLPKGMFSDIVYRAFDKNDFKKIQGVAENYSEYNNYKDYIINVFVPSKPFYLTSNYRERVFYSYVSPHILPIWEFPYHERF